ncbi:MAG: hypothetical protein ACC652_11240 [Acidimicrobiales bacterium]
MSDIAPRIGTLGEKPLHASLKRWCSQPGDRFEVPVDRFVIDIVRGNRLIEVQTRGFSAMKRKATVLLEQGYELCIVHPIPVNKWIVKLDTNGEVLTRRRSPKHGTPMDIFTELVSFPNLVAHPHLEIKVLLIDEEEMRFHTPDRSWRRKGWSIKERRLLDVVDIVTIAANNDLAAFLPAGLPVPFTTADLAAELGRPRRLAQQMTYCLRVAEVISATGKKGNAIEYEIV